MKNTMGKTSTKKLTGMADHASTFHAGTFHKKSAQIASAEYGHVHTKKRKKRATAAMVTAAILALAVLCTALLSSGNAIQAQEDGQACKMYTSIQIEKGDTLWAIAGRYMDGHYSSIQEYIDEVKSINELTSDTIHEDAYLLVPYYQA